MFTYSREGRFLATIKINEMLIDATWTPNGHIVYTSKISSKVVVMSESGKIINSTQMNTPQFISVSYDNIIFLADGEAGVYQSTDDGISWDFVFHQAENWCSHRVMKVPTGHGDDFWTLVSRSVKVPFDYQLHVYSVLDKKYHAENNMTWKKINLPMTKGKKFDLSLYSIPLYDDSNNIFLNDKNNKGVHLFSAKDYRHTKLLLSDRIKTDPRMMMLDHKRQLLYVAQDMEMIQVFKLSHDD